MNTVFAHFFVLCVPIDEEAHFTIATNDKHVYVLYYIVQMYTKRRGV